ncbi:hypothetical protein SprV_1002842100 [Sparganum proliferum]
MPHRRKQKVLLHAASCRKIVDVLLNGQAVRLQLDTASDIIIIIAIIISERFWNFLGNLTMRQTSQSATSACGCLAQQVLCLIRRTVKLVVVKKPNGSIRICANFLIDPNVALAQNCYPPPIPPDIFSRLNDGTCFDQLDLADAYLQIEIVPDSYELLTINTHRDLFQYTRLRVGVKAAPTLFQQTANALLSGIPGPAGHLDDIIVIVGHSPAELQDRVCEQYSANKYQFFLGSIKFLEFVVYVTGRNPDPENITAAQQIPAPKNVSQLSALATCVSPPSASHVSVKLPPFWPRNVELWIALCEAEFEACNVTLQDTMFNHLQRSLHDEYAEELCGLLIHRPSEQPYDKLKEALVKRVAMTEKR